MNKNLNNTLKTTIFESMQNKIEKINMPTIKREHFIYVDFAKNDNIIIEVELKSIENDEAIN